MAAIEAADVAAKAAEDATKVAVKSSKGIVGSLTDAVKSSLPTPKDLLTRGVKYATGGAVDIGPLMEGTSATPTVDENAEAERQHKILLEQHATKMDEYEQAKNAQEMNKAVHEFSRERVRESSRRLKRMRHDDPERAALKEERRIMIRESKRRIKMNTRNELPEENEAEAAAAPEPKGMWHNVTKMFGLNKAAIDTMSPDAKALLGKHRESSMFGPGTSFGPKLPKYYTPDYYEKVKKSKGLSKGFFTDILPRSYEVRDGDTYEDDAAERASNASDLMDTELAGATFDKKLYQHKKYFERRGSQSSLRSVGSSISSIGSWPNADAVVPTPPPEYMPTTTAKKTGGWTTRKKVAAGTLGTYLALQLAKTGTNIAADSRVASNASANKNQNITINTQGSTYRVA